MKIKVSILAILAMFHDTLLFANPNLREKTSDIGRVIQNPDSNDPTNQYFSPSLLLPNALNSLPGNLQRCQNSSFQLGQTSIKVSYDERVAELKAEIEGIKEDLFRNSEQIIYSENIFSIDKNGVTFPIKDASSLFENKNNRVFEYSNNTKIRQEQPAIISESIQADKCDQRQKSTDSCIKLLKKSLSEPLQIIYSTSSDIAELEFDYKKYKSSEAHLASNKLNSDSLLSEEKNQEIFLPSIIDETINGQGLSAEEAIELRRSELDLNSKSNFNLSNSTDEAKIRKNISIELLATIDQKAAIGGDPTKEMVLLKKTNPSAHRALSCLLNSSKTLIDRYDPLTNTFKPNLRTSGKAVGPLSGIIYWDSNTQQDSNLLAVYAAAITSAAAVFTIFGNNINDSLKSKDQKEAARLARNHELSLSSIKANEARKLRDHQASEAKKNREEAAKQREHEAKQLEWKKYESGFKTDSLGTKPGCDGEGTCMDPDDVRDNPDKMDTPMSQPQTNNDSIQKNDSIRKAPKYAPNNGEAIASSKPTKHKNPINIRIVPSDSLRYRNDSGEKPSQHCVETTKANLQLHFNKNFWDKMVLDSLLEKNVITFNDPKFKPSLDNKPIPQDCLRSTYDEAL